MWSEVRLSQPPNAVLSRSGNRPTDLHDQSGEPVSTLAPQQSLKIPTLVEIWSDDVSPVARNLRQVELKFPPIRAQKSIEQPDLEDRKQDAILEGFFLK